MKRKEYTSLGRLHEYRTRSDATTLAVKAPERWDGDYEIIHFATREAMIEFVRHSKSRAISALIKNRVSESMMIDCRYQTPVVDDGNHKG